jgi:hypothetical protein
VNQNLPQTACWQEKGGKQKQAGWQAKGVMKTKHTGRKKHV